ncbi:MAG: RNA pseudouridine synthase [Muribaculaceae bacterium]|nr:RNA pseudouridine synthase [Muribaculaceae bacterium]
MNNPFCYTPSPACIEIYRNLCERIEAMGRSPLSADKALYGEFHQGKMLGVMIAEDAAGRRYELCAFSGQLGVGGFHCDGFVGPVFDYLAPNGYFKTREAEITLQNLRIEAFQKDMVAVCEAEYLAEKERHDARLEQFRLQIRQSKQARDAERSRGPVDEVRDAQLIKQSQFEKAELRRLKQSAAESLAPLASRLQNCREELERMKLQRRADSVALQQWLFDNFQVLDARGESRSLSRIFADTPMGVPPSGTGECCAPKLLQEAYRRRLTPVEMAEFWYGSPKDGELRIHGNHYPACRGKCGPLLRWMLQGLPLDIPLNDDCFAAAHVEPQILFENEWFCIVNKPSGMLSVPGKGRAQSLEHWLIERYGADREVKMAHRLDQDTSGLIVAAFGAQSLKVLQSLFASGQVSKEYEAIVCGDYRACGISPKGNISLPIAPDLLDRPRQRVDTVNGRRAVTDYEFQGVENGNSRVIFRPLTGRTHQLRVHSASPGGLGMPILGDRLYAANAYTSAVEDRFSPNFSAASSPTVSTVNPHSTVRLHLHARSLHFTFPLTGQTYRFSIPPPF